MIVGVYFHGKLLNAALKSIASALRKKGLDIQESDCLCKIVNDEELPKAILIHPNPINRYNCWGKIKKVIMNNPNVKFYLSMYSEYERQEVIGEHPNLVYIDQSNASKCFREIIELGK